MEIVVKLLFMLWLGLLVACFLAFLVVAATLARANKAMQGTPGAPVGSTIGWVVASIVGFVVWGFFSLALVGFGLGHSSGPGNLNVALFAISLLVGPPLYIFIGVRKYKAVTAQPIESAIRSE